MKEEEQRHRQRTNDAYVEIGGFGGFILVAQSLENGKVILHKENKEIK